MPSSGATQRNWVNVCKPAEDEQDHREVGEHHDDRQARSPRPSRSQTQPIAGFTATATPAKITSTTPARTGLIPLPFTISVFDQVTKP